jgi:hypothetical protein
MPKSLFEVVPRYLFESFTHSVYDNFNIGISLIDLNQIDIDTEKPAIYWDKAVGEQSCAQCLADVNSEDWKKCWKDRLRWINAVQSQEKGWDGIQYCHRKRMNRLLPIRDEIGILLGIMIPGFIMDSRVNYDVSKDTYSPNELSMTEDEFIEKTDGLKALAEHFSHIYLAERDFGPALNEAPFAAESELKERLFKLRSWDPDNSKAFFEEILSIFNIIVPSKLSTFWIRHTQENPVQDYALLRSIVTQDEDIKLEIMRAPDRIVLQLDGGTSILPECFRTKEILHLHDFTQEARFKWTFLNSCFQKKNVLGRSFISIPLIIGDKVIAAVGLHPNDELQILDGFTRQTIQLTARNIALSFEKFILSGMARKSEKFRTAARNLVDKLGEDYYRELRRVFSAAVPRATIDIWLYDTSEDVLRKVVEEGEVSKVITEKADSESLPWRIFKTEAPQDHGQISVLAYPLYRKDKGLQSTTGEIEISMGAQLRDFSKTDRQTVGVVCCTKKMRRVDDLADAFLDEERDYLGHRSFVVSLFVGSLDFAQRTHELMTTLGHEVVKPLSCLFESIQIMDYYKRKKNDNDYDKTYSNLRDLFKFCTEYTFNLVRLGGQSTLGSEENLDFYREILMPIIKYLGTYAKVDRGIKINVSGQFPSQYKLDASGMQQALFNIIMNAVKYSKRTEENDILVWGTKDIKYWIIRVQDWGIGIPEKEKDRVFRKYAYCSNSRDHDNTGLGLGCHIAKQIIELHGGSVEVTHSSDPTEITIKLPLSR